MEHIDSHPNRPFLDALIEDLEPVQPASSWLRSALSWYGSASLFVVVAILATGPVRESLAIDLKSLGFLLEVSVGAMAALGLCAAALEVGVPGAPSRLRLLLPGLTLLSAWLVLTVFGSSILGEVAGSPAHSMLGKREHCFIQGMSISILPLGVAILSLRRRSLYARSASGLLFGAAAGTLVSVSMQAACMYEPVHALRFHLSPILFLALAGAICARLVLPDPS